MSDFKQAILAGAIIGAVLGLCANYAHASTASANHGHHSGGNHGALGDAAGSFGGSPSAGQASASAGGQSGQGGSYGDWYLRSNPIDNYQPWPQAEMKQFQKP